MSAPAAVAGHEHRPPVVAVGDHAADRPSNTYGISRQIVAAPTQADGARCAVDVAEQSSVESQSPSCEAPLAAMSARASKKSNKAAICGTGAHTRTLMVGRDGCKRQ